MFPRSIFYIIFFIIMDLIMKSIKEKRKTQEKRAKETKEIMNKTPNVMQKSPKREKSQIIKSEKSLEMKPFEEIFTDTDDIYTGIQDEIDIDMKNRKDKKLLEIEREEILKGIIYSEILSKPKSLRK